MHQRRQRLQRQALPGGSSSIIPTRIRLFRNRSCNSQSSSSGLKHIQQMALPLRSPQLRHGPPISRRLYSTPRETPVSAHRTGEPAQDPISSRCTAGRPDQSTWQWVAIFETGHSAPPGLSAFTCQQPGSPGCPQQVEPVEARIHKFFTSIRTLVENGSGWSQLVIVFRSAARNPGERIFGWSPSHIVSSL